MDYIRVKLKMEPFSAGVSELLTAGLDFLGYEGIQEEEPFLLAYISADKFRPNELDQYLENLDTQNVAIKLESETIPPKNWNAEWEKQYQPVIIDGLCAIRAPFHGELPGLTNIVIEPKMSFGTGHHETTKLMMQQVHQAPVEGKMVLDMGCGTGVLGIYALLRGARHVTAIDIDEWAYTNCRENFARNIPDPERYSLVMGDASSIPDYKFDVILANINRNIILDDMESYVDHLLPGGLLILSGILETDKDRIVEKASDFNLIFVSELYDNNWISVKFSV